MNEGPFNRVLIKISGEVLMGAGHYGIDPATVERVAGEVGRAAAASEVCLVVGGGNIFRGLSETAKGMTRGDADYMGMLATVMNALALADALRRFDVDARVLSAIAMPTVCEPFSRARAMKHLRLKRLVIFAAGTGNPYFTTDTAAALRAAEMGCDALLKGTSVDGVYDEDPKTSENAKRLDRISYNDVLARDLKVMDAAAVALARDNAIPIIVFSIKTDGAITDIVSGQGRYTVIS